MKITPNSITTNANKQQLTIQLKEAVSKLKHLAVNGASYAENMEQAAIVLDLWNRLDKLKD
jgi:hypothetical protein